jgi:hypothetical protein
MSHHCQCFQHMGGHSGADYVGCIHRSTPASLDEQDTADLKAELEGRGYRLKVVRRRTPQMRDEFNEELRKLAQNLVS